ncbi:MAG: alpha-L-fucosidase [Phycisphaerae bacterium]|nr:alpha-L-fucosidase [Phycisphaerae bacterium]
MATRRKPGRRRAARKTIDPLAWWRHARFGMFIHWGLYSVAGGYWKGQPIPRLGEWIMQHARIPLAEYAQLAQRFNPVRFSAQQWVALAKQAGMKYLVITAKHHDGFAMYDSPCSDYDIVDATPFGRDPIAELARACRKSGLKLGFYYSQYQDWADPNGASSAEALGSPEKDFEKYFRSKCIPQVRELLTQYGPIGLIWFDTPGTMSREQSLELKEIVHSLQPHCLVSGRVGNDVGDYGSLGDNQVPRRPVVGDWETPATVNDTWGFKRQDHHWKPAGTLLYLLVDLASKGVNYLLNVGPTGKGVIPTPSVNRLREVGRWMKVNGQAIYGTAASPFPYTHDWGRITQQGHTLYLMFLRWPRREFVLHGLRNKVRRAWLLGARRRRVPVRQRHAGKLDHHVIALSLPARAPDRHVSVVAMELVGRPDADQMPIQQGNGSIHLQMHLARLHCPDRAAPIHVSQGGLLDRWTSKKNWMSWEFRVFQPGLFRLELVSRCGKDGTVPSGHTVGVMLGKATLEGITAGDTPVKDPATRYHPEAATTLGRLRITQAGTHTLRLNLLKLPEGDTAGPRLTAVNLVPA